MKAYNLLAPTIPAFISSGLSTGTCLLIMTLKDNYHMSHDNILSWLPMTIAPFIGGYIGGLLVSVFKPKTPMPRRSNHFIL